VDPADASLLAALRADLDSHDPVPAAVLESARAALTWRTVDAELAALTADSALTGAGVRASAGSRALTFECDTGVIVLEVLPEDEVRTLVGQTDRPAALEVRHGGEPLRVETDEHGRFRVEGIRAGPVSVRAVFADSPGSPVVTSWVVV
jgi:hypothetical protein